MSAFWSAVDIVARCVLVVLSAASFVPQLHRVLARGNLEGISSRRIFLEPLIATYYLAMVTFATFEYPLDDEPFGAANVLDLAQFGVVWLGQLAAFCLYLILPPFDHSSGRRKLFFTLAFMFFATVTLYPAISGAFIPRTDKSNSAKWRHMYWSLIVSPMISIGLIMQLVGWYAASCQTRKTKLQGSSGSLNINGLLMQAIVSFLVGISMAVRIRKPGPGPEDNSNMSSAINTSLFDVPEDLPTWCVLVAVLGANNLVLSLAQGLMWRNVRNSCAADELEEREPLLGRNA